MNTNDVVWLLSARADRLAYLPTELQEFGTANFLHIASVLNYQYPTEKNNGAMVAYNMYDAPAARTIAPVKSFPGTVIAAVKDNFTAEGKRTLTSNWPTAQLLLPLTNVKLHKVGEVSYFTQLEPAFIEYLGDILDLEDLVGKKLTGNVHLDAYNFRSGSNGEITHQLMTKHSCWVDEVGTIALLNDDLVEKFKEKFANVDGKVKALKTASLYKGASPYFGPDSQSIANLASGGRFFLYSTKIEVFTNGEKSEVPFIGLAVFGGDKLVRYKNALSLLERLQNFSNSLNTQSLLYPEKYKEILKMQAPAVAQFWPGMVQIIGEKNIEKTKFNFTDAATIKSDDHGKFKAFFINSTIQKTPEASRFLAMKGKREALDKTNKEMQAKLQSQKSTIAEMRETIEQSLAQITNLKRIIVESGVSLDATTTALINTTPQAERTSNAVLEIARALEPLEADYQKAIGKYGDADTSLDILKAWENEGVVIREIVITERTHGTALTTPKAIRDAFVAGDVKNFYISKMVVVTTKPSIIYKNAHRVGREKAEQYAAGPFIVTMTSDGYHATHTVRLYDDRSIRGIWSDRGYKKLKVHPHCAETYLSEADFNYSPGHQWQQWTKMEHRTCPGDFEPILVKGMKEMTLQPLIYGLRAWLETADASDQWGQYVNKFPRASEVMIETFGLPKAPEAAKLEEIKPLFNKQITLLKRDEAKTTALIFLFEDAKAIAIKAEGEIKDNKLTLVEKDRSVMFFLNPGQRESSVNETRSTLEADGYSLFAEQKLVNELTLVFPMAEKPVTPAEVTNVTDEGETYRPAARRATEQVITELQNLVDNTAQTVTF